MVAGAFVLGASFWAIAKIFLLFAFLLYIVFALVVIRQVNLMIETLQVGFEWPIKLLAWGHLLFAIGAFVLALIIL